MQQNPIAVKTDKANEQHYEVPADFFDLVLGKNRKYSCCYWDTGENDLGRAEQRALDDLPTDYRMAVVLADLEGFSYKEIAEILELPVGTVMSRLYRGRKLLEESMLRYARDHGYLRDDAQPAKMRSRRGRGKTAADAAE